MTQRVVTYTYGTGNPVLPNGSIDVRDGIDNIQSLDVFMNAPEDTYNQRNGNIVSTVSGANNRFDAQIINMGFTRVGTFEAGATLTNTRQTLLWDIADGGDGQEYGWSGSFPKVVPAASTPASTGGISVGAWISRLDPELRIQVREALIRSYVEAGYNLVPGSFEAGGTLVNANDVLLHEASGKAFSGPAGTVAAGTDPASGGFVDRGVLGVAFSSAEVQSKLDAGFKVVQAFVPTITTPISIPQNSTVIFNGVTRVAMNGNVFTIVTGSRVYCDLIVNSGFNPTIGYVDGTFRPTMLLADNRRAGIYGTFRSENPTPNARALFLDGNARDGKRGIISWFECDITLRNIARACDVDASNPTGIEGAKSYVNNNYLRIAMWDVPYGYIEADIDTSKAEIAANDVWLDYQSSAVSVQVVRNRGTRNNLHGNIWDTDRTAYPSLLSSAIDIGGSANTVGGANWPSPASNVVSITDVLCDYTGYTYGTAKRVVKPLTVLARLGVDQGNGVEASVVGQLGAISNPVNIPAGAVLQSVFARTYGFNSNRVPYFIDGYVLLKNSTLSPVNVQVKFGPTSSDGALSQTFQVAAQRVKRLDLSLMISTLRQNATCGDGSWYGTLNYSALTVHEVHVQITSAEGVTVDGLVLRRSSEL